MYTKSIRVPSTMHQELSGRKVRLEARYIGTDALSSSCYGVHTACIEDDDPDAQHLHQIGGRSTNHTDVDRRLRSSLSPTS